MHRGYEPTQDEIRRGCAEIQAGWSAEVEAARRYNPHRVECRLDGWLPPGCRCHLDAPTIPPACEYGR